MRIGTRKGRALVCSIFPSFFAFCNFVVSSGILLVSWHHVRLVFVSYTFPLLLFLVVPLLFSKNADTLSF